MKGSSLSQVLDEGVALQDNEAKLQEQLKEELGRWEQANQKLLAMTATAREKALEQRQRLEQWETNLANLKFDLERSQARQLGKLWTLVTFSLLVFVFHSFYKGVYVAALLNGIAFLANWRMLYVREAPHALVYGLATMLFTWFLVWNRETSEFNKETHWKKKQMDKKRVRSDDLERQRDQRFQKQSGIKKLLGNGTYNCAHELEDGSVLRIGLLNEETSGADMVRRGLVNLSAFQAYERYLGPLLLKESEPWKILRLDEIPTEITRAWCNQLNNARETNSQFAFQYLENLRGGEFSEWLFPNANILAFTTYSLLWFVRNAEQGFQFLHHDLKPANIMIRTYEEMTRFAFQTSSGNIYYFESDQAPVVIDYDFASTYLTRDANVRDVLGTPEYAPPEAIAFHILRRSNEERRPEEVRGYDWWAIGYILLETLFLRWAKRFPEKMAPMRALLKDCHPYAKEVGKQFMERYRIYDSPRQKQTKRYFKSFVESLIIARAVKGAPLAMRDNDAYDVKTFEIAFDNLPGARAINEAFNSFFPKYFGGLIEILKGLLHESPIMRQQYKYLEAPWFSPFKMDSLKGGADLYYSQRLPETTDTKLDRVRNAEFLQRQI